MRSFTFTASRLAGIALLTGMLAGTAAAQTASTPPTYAGPRYPGGPDSLRSYVARQLRAANPAWVGDVFLQLSLAQDGTVREAEFLAPPPGTPAATLVRNRDVQALVTRVVQQMPSWLPPADPDARPKVETAYLRLPFGAPAPAPLAYSDEVPLYPKIGQRPVGSTVSEAVYYLQRSFRYPAEALRARTQGKAYLYYEVSETGAVEHRLVVGSLSPSVDAEALRTLATLPDASLPPRQQGRPVRVYYVVPLTLSIR